MNEDVPEDFKDRPLLLAYDGVPYMRATSDEAMAAIGDAVERPHGWVWILIENVGLVLAVWPSSESCEHVRKAMVDKLPTSSMPELAKKKWLYGGYGEAKS